MKRSGILWLLIPVLALGSAVLATCSSDNVIGPGNQLQVTNATDDFQFQVSGLDNVKQTLTYSWSKVSGSGTVTFGSASSLSTTASFSSAGSYTLRLEKLPEFAMFADEARLLVSSIEMKLTEEYKKQLK